MGYETSQLGQQISRNDAVTVGATAVTVSLPNERTMFVLRNVSTGGQVISIALSDTGEAVANKGIVLNVNDFFGDSDNASYQCWKGKITAIASAAGGSLAVTEIPRQRFV